MFISYYDLFDQKVAPNFCDFIELGSSYHNELYIILQPVQRAFKWYLSRFSRLSQPISVKHLNFLFKNLKFSFFNISAHSFLRSCDRSDFIPQIGSPTQPSHHVMFHLPRSCVTSIELRPFLRALLLAPLFKLHFCHPIVFYTFRATPQRNQRVFSFRMIP